jgi:hypothetical protein
MVFNATQQYLNYIFEVCFIDGGKQEYLEKITDLSQVTENFIT